jgi:hypothetical protein
MEVVQFRGVIDDLAAIEPGPLPWHKSQCCVSGSSQNLPGIGGSGGALILVSLSPSTRV